METTFRGVANGPAVPGSSEPRGLEGTEKDSRLPKSDFKRGKKKKGILFLSLFTCTGYRKWRINGGGGNGRSLKVLVETGSTGEGGGGLPHIPLTTSTLKWQTA